MQFTIPTTKEQMYAVLQQIFNFYRVQKAPYNEVELVPLTLEKDVFIPLSDEQLLLKAKSLLDYKYSKEYPERVKELESEKAKLLAIKLNLEEEFSEKKNKLEEQYEQSINNVKVEAKKNGFATSSVVLSAISKLEQERASKISELSNKQIEKSGEIDSKISVIESQIVEVSSYLAMLLEKEALLKVEELKNEQKKIARDVFRYNNSLDEKEQKSQSAITQVKANLALKYAEINSHEISKDRLIDLGYYNDVITCISGFYDNQFSSPLEAYTDITKESKLMVYLEDYYTDFVYMYKQRAIA